MHNFVSEFLDTLKHVENVFSKKGIDAPRCITCSLSYEYVLLGDDSTRLLARTNIHASVIGDLMTGGRVSECAYQTTSSTAPANVSC